MALLDWNDRYAIGVHTIDDRHRELVNVINRTHAKLFQDEAGLTAPEFYRDLLHELSAHFAAEERLMRDQGYVGLAEHSDHHELLLADIREATSIFENADEIDSLDLAIRLDAWLSSHFKAYGAGLYAAIGAQAR